MGGWVTSDSAAASHASTSLLVRSASRSISGTLEDRVARLDGEVRQRVGQQAAHAGDARQGVGELPVVAEVDAGSRQGVDAADAAQHQPAPQLRGQLRGQDPQDRALERLAVLEARRFVVGQHRAQQLDWNSSVSPAPPSGSRRT